MTSPAASFSEIRALVAELPPLDLGIWGGAIARPTPATGNSFADAAWVAAVQRRAAPRVDHPRMILFAAAHGIAAELPEGSPAAVARQVQALLAVSSEIARVAEAADCELKLHELAIERPSRDSRLAPAMDEAEAAMAAAYGMMAVEPGLDAVAIADLGPTPDHAALSLGLALAPDARTREANTPDARAEAACVRHRGVSDPLGLLAALGGADLAAMLGVILASRLAGIPVILEGLAAEAAAAVAWRLRADAIDHCRLACPGRLGLPVPSQLSHSIAPPTAGIAALVALREACLAEASLA